MENRMALFCVNLHFRTMDDKAVSASLDRLGVTRYRIIPAKNGWTSLYEERASDQDDARIRDLADGLSEDLDVAAIAFMVHDSDVACYWLFDNGQLLDEYNSCPDYFDDDASRDEPQRPSGGRPDILVRYCRSGVQQDELAAILATETLFAENLIERIAEALGIDRGRALTDYRDVADGDGPGGGDGSDDGGDGDDHGGGPSADSLGAGLARRFAATLGSDQRSATADPEVMSLVQATVGDDIDAIDRLLAKGVAIDAEAPAPLSSGQPAIGLGQLFPAGVPKIAMTPLLAAVVNKRHRAAERLLDGGADPNRAHPLFGTPVHAATGAGEEGLLQLLIDHGGDVSGRDARGQSPLQVVAAGRATRDRMAQTQALMKSMGIKFAGLLDQVANVTLPIEGWDACERLLKAQGAR
jgi:hypothetical protein